MLTMILPMQFVVPGPSNHQRTQRTVSRARPQWVPRWTMARVHDRETWEIYATLGKGNVTETSIDEHAFVIDY